MPARLTRILVAAASAAGLVFYRRYRKEIRAIRDAVSRGSTIAETAAGDIEYAETGDGEPIFSIHGAGGGYDQGLLIASDFGDGYRIIAPSRFGYLKAPVPADHSPAAQAGKVETSPACETPPDWLHVGDAPFAELAAFHSKLL